MTRQQVVITLVGLAVVLALAAWVRANLEWREETIFVGASGEARRDPMLAATRILRAFGVEVRETDSPHWSRARGHLVIWNPPLVMDVDAAQALAERVEGGLHLVTTFHTRARIEYRVWLDAAPESARTPAGAVRWAEASATSAPSLLVETLFDVEAQRPADDGQVAWSAFWRERLGETGSRPDFDLTVESAPGDDYQRMTNRQIGCVELYAAARRVVAIECPLGGGVVTLLTDPGAFANHRIGRNARAAAWVDLVDADAGDIVLMDDGFNVSLSLWRWLQLKAPPLVLVSILAIVLFAWSRCLRFGPAFDVEPPVRRALLEHLDAAGRFAWRHDRGSALLARLAESVRTLAARRVPNFERLDAATRAERLADITGLPPARVALALEDSTESGRTAFVSRVRALSALRERLASARRRSKESPS